MYMYIMYYTYTLQCTIHSQSLSCGIVERVLSWAQAKSQAQLNKKQHGAKHSKLKGIPKLDDANDAGGKNSRLCTLIVTEGDSAKSLAVSGLGVVGRDQYGVFPLRGKLLNVREASHSQVSSVKMWLYTCTYMCMYMCPALRKYMYIMYMCTCYSIRKTVLSYTVIIYTILYISLCIIHKTFHLNAR